MPLGIKIVSQNCQGLVEMSGKYQHTVESSLHFYIPIVQNIRTVSLAMHRLNCPIILLSLKTMLKFQLLLR